MWRSSPKVAQFGGVALVLSSFVVSTLFLLFGVVGVAFVGVE